MKIHCIGCGYENHFPLFLYQNHKVVSSDSKLVDCNFELVQCQRCNLVQKRLDDELKTQIDRIYKNYQSYYLNNGKEELKIVDNKSSSRSELIIQNIKHCIKKSGNILDIGTGSGVFLQEFHKNFHWDLYGQDVKDNTNGSLVSLDSFKKLYILNEETLPVNHFHIISAIHVFEHIFDLSSFLDGVKKSLKTDGFLLLQVPYLNQNIFDIFILDHVSHFTVQTIATILKQKFQFIYFSKNQIDKELTVIASDSPMNGFETTLREKDIDVAKSLESLIQYLASIKYKVAIFGTSPPALFCASYLDFQLECFVDENEAKASKELYGKKIVLPKTLDENTKVLFPYSKTMLEGISKRYPKIEFLCLEDVIEGIR